MNALKPKFLLTLCALILTSASYAKTITTTVTATDGKTPLGQVTFEDSQYGLLIIPKLHNLPVGLHGFHLHQNPNCSDKGMAAKGHYDPQKTNTHQGPYAAGHLGDLPVLAVGSDGTANTPILAPRLTTKDIPGLALMIHAGGDNYSNTPTLGGGGARIGCGAIAQ